MEYRTVTFEKEQHPVADWQGTSVINYPELSFPFTRICEPKHFYREKWGSYAPDQTIIFKEIPGADSGEAPYYPINDSKNTALAQRYKAEAAAFFPNIIFGGRLGEYKYYNMCDVIASALSAADGVLARLQK